MIEDTCTTAQELRLARAMGEALARIWAEELGGDVQEALRGLDLNIIPHGVVAAVTFEDMDASDARHAQIGNAACEGIASAGFDWSRY